MSPTPDRPENSDIARESRGRFAESVAEGRLQAVLAAAAAFWLVMLAISFVLLLVINALQWWAANRHKNSEPLEVAAGKAKAGEA